MSTTTYKDDGLVPIRIGDRELDLNEVCYWGDKQLTVAQLSMAVKQYEKIKTRASINTTKRRAREKAARAHAPSTK